MLCYCETCQKFYHPLGIMRHRAMHRERKENCVIRMKKGTFEYNFAGLEKPRSRLIEGQPND